VHGKSLPRCVRLAPSEWVSHLDRCSALVVLCAGDGVERVLDGVVVVHRLTLGPQCMQASIAEGLLQYGGGLSA
jgi:hypothetical protein